MKNSAAIRLYAQPWADYQLLDVGNGKKLERWGRVITIRPECQANNRAVWSYDRWRTMAHWQFEEQSSTRGLWKMLKDDAPRAWWLSYQQLQLHLKLTQFKHLGVFPEQQANWHFIQQHIKAKHQFLNLFAYTGVASLVARSQGAAVVHVDSVKPIINWANENREASSVEGIRWIIEDAMTFAQRELKRGRQYQGIIMDPPAWGLGNQGERWKLSHHLGALLEIGCALLSPQGFLILNTYSPAIQYTDLLNLAARYFSDHATQICELWSTAQTGNELFYGYVLRVVR